MAQMYGVPEFFVTFTANETWALWLRLDSSWSLLMP